MYSGKILIVDDDKDIVNLMCDILSDECYEVNRAFNGYEAIGSVKNEKYDLIILDIMLPDMNGYDVLREIRNKTHCPIIFLTAKSKITDKIVGLETGADDYITKPFDDGELVARVRAHIRREKRVNSGNDNSIISYKVIKINKNSLEVFVNGESIELSNREFQILSYMMDNPNKPLSREEIYNNVWNYGDFGDINTVTVHIKKLREKIDKNDKFIKTIWGVGYKFIGEK